MSGVQSYLSHAIAKPLFAGIAAAAGDHYVMGNPDMKMNAIFGASVGAGIFSVSWVEPIVSAYMPTATFIGAVGKTLEGRIVEIALGSASAYAINTYAMNNNYDPNSYLMRIGIVAASDLIAESACEFLAIV